jgi:4'-phosphopantetheinyl transferase
MLNLASDEIALWCAFPSEIADPGLLREYRAILSDAERDREPRFQFARDRLRYLLTRTLVRTVLARYAPVAPHEWVFTTNRYGKPCVANNCRAARRIAFNVTHTDGLIMLAVGRDIAVGIDAEHVRRHESCLSIADRYFAPEEVEALRSLPQSMQLLRFLEYWTLKESYIKARGMGLSIPLDRFSFSFRRERYIEFATHPDQLDAPSRWTFWQFHVVSQYIASLCVERQAGSPLHVTAKRIVPLVSESQLEHLVLRVSEELLGRPL